jgi:hypothetical protein
MFPFIFFSRYRRAKHAVIKARKRTSKKTENVILVLMLEKAIANPVYLG